MENTTKVAATTEPPTKLSTQNSLLLKNLLDFFENRDNLEKMMVIVNNESHISLRLVDWVVTNYSKKYYTVYKIKTSMGEQRFKVYNEYKLKLKAYGKIRYDVFKRWERISVPVAENEYIETTLGQLNFFKWAISNKVLDYIEKNYKEIEMDMNQRNTVSKKRTTATNYAAVGSEPAPTAAAAAQTRKKREELSVSACKTMKKEFVEITVKFT
jgi:hypothetical protein